MDAPGLGSNNWLLFIIAMSFSMNCPDCLNPHSLAATQCPHCYRPSNYPNVAFANRPEETLALDNRFQKATVEANLRGAAVKVQEFELEASKSQAVMARDLAELGRIAHNDNESYANFYKLADSGVRAVDLDDEWAQRRLTADTILFPVFHKQICFAALTLDDRGLSKFGNCLLFFKEEMIAHRATVFEENSVMFMKNHNIKAFDPDVPRGFKAAWDARGNLCVAKLAGKIDANTFSTSFPEILLQERTKGEDDEFVEVHIFGSFTRRSLNRVIITNRGGRALAKYPSRNNLSIS
jgi:hypothetical protein